MKQNTRKLEEKLEQAVVGIDEIKVPGLEREQVQHEDYTLEIIKDNDRAVDVTFLNKKDPNFEYRFIYAKDSNLSRRTGNLLYHGGGWQIVPRRHLEKLGLGEGKPGFAIDKKISPDGFYRVGDLILAFMPKHLFEQKAQKKEEANVAPLKRVVRRLKEGDHSHELAGGLHPSQRGIQTAKELGMD